MSEFPSVIPNWIGGKEVRAASQGNFEKVSPATGKTICRVVRSQEVDADSALCAAEEARAGWACTPAVERGRLLFQLAAALQANSEKMARAVALETGKSLKDARGETAAAVSQGHFMAGEGQRLYGRTTTSALAGKFSMTVREPRGVAVLIIAANTPIANLAWKVFPALICGNAVVLKGAEDTPLSSWLFGQIAHESGLPPGVLNIIQGYGQEVGAPLVADGRADLVSFTGSTAVGREIARVCAERTAVVSLELGGKNPFVVCDDADIDKAVHWAVLSAFSNAGQRCASGSRLLVFSSIYDDFRDRLIQAVEKLRIGPDDDLGPVINERQLISILSAIDQATSEGASTAIGGYRLTRGDLANGFYVAPTVLEGTGVSSAFSMTEVFGPVTALYRVDDINEAVEVANATVYGLTAAIHTKNIDRAWWFARQVRSGVVSVNAGTFGSEPHMPFGGLGASGNGTREPGTEALDVYSELKNINLTIDSPTAH